MTRTISVTPTTLLLMSVCHLLSALEGSQPQNKSARPGENATLPCSVPSDVSVSAVEWRRRNDPEKYVYLSRDGNVDIRGQDPSFTGRVGLADSEMKNGDLSLILKNVSSSDTGTYECYYKGSTRRRIRAIIKGKPISIIKLNVETPASGGGHSGHVGLAVGLSVGALVLLTVAVTIGIVFKKRRCHTNAKCKMRCEQEGTGH